jgi:hypothetical protein
MEGAMAWFWRFGLGVGLLIAATPAAAQQYDPVTAMELKRASKPARDYCLRRTKAKAEAAGVAADTFVGREGFAKLVEDGTIEQLIAEEASLNRRILLARARGEDADDMRANALGDLLARYRVVVTKVAAAKGRPLSQVEPGTYDSQRDIAHGSYESERRRHNEALLECLEYKDRFPNREWVDSNADATSGEFGAPPSDETPIGNRWTNLPPADADRDALPEKKGVDYRVWMTGTFDTGGGVMTLNPAGGRYAYQNGRMSTTSINGTVMEGRWEQDMSAGKCEDGRYWGKYRLTFTSGGFSGVFGYCDEEPHRTGGFQGQRRGS